jgi:exopolysaccharide/PEP-CTERM locus tyrosine autokinase
MSSIEKAIEKLDKREKSDDYRLRTQDSRDNFDREASVHATERHEVIDFSLLRTFGMITPDNPNSVIAEEYRHIKRPILQNAFGSNAKLIDHGQLVLVTSAVPGEGKTFTAINLALSIAMEMDKTVLLVDADMSMYGISRTLGFEPGNGLADVLFDDNTPLSKVLMTTNIPKLTIMSAGKYQSRKAELLSSDNMKRLISELAHRYSDRIIIFDAPPLMATSEAQVLASMMGQIVFVIEEGKTAQRLVHEAVSSLDQSKAIGFVLNKSRRSMVSSYGYYGYGAKRK